MRLRLFFKFWNFEGDTERRYFRDVGEGTRDSGIRIEKGDGYPVSSSDFSFVTWIYKSGGALDGDSTMHLMSDGKIDTGHALFILDGATGRFASSMGGAFKN